MSLGSEAINWVPGSANPNAPVFVAVGIAGGVLLGATLTFNLTSIGVTLLTATAVGVVAALAVAGLIAGVYQIAKQNRIGVSEKGVHLGDRSKPVRLLPWDILLSPDPTPQYRGQLLVWKGQRGIDLPLDTLPQKRVLTARAAEAIYRHPSCPREIVPKEFLGEGR